MAKGTDAVNTTEAVASEEKPVKKRTRRTKAEIMAAEASEASSAAKKPSATKKAEPKTSVIIEYQNRQAVVKDIVAAATKAYKKANRGVVIKKIEIYVKPEENVAYYVVNGVGREDYKIEL